MKSRKLKLLALILSLMMIFSILSACTTGKTDDEADLTKKTEATGDTSEDALSNMTGRGVLPIVESPVTLTIGHSRLPTITDWDDNHFTHWLEEKTGLNFEFELWSSAEVVQKIQLLIASDSVLPDIIFNSLNKKDVDTYGMDGYFLPVDDYIEKYGYHLEIEAAKVGDAYDILTGGGSFYQWLLDISKAPDGKSYVYGHLHQDPTTSYARQWYINQKWLDTLGLDKPKTTDEFYNVLKAFKNNDPNQNGKPDEIPLVGSPTGWYTQVEIAVLSAFTYIPFPVRSMILNEKDEVDAFFIKEEYKEGLRYLNTLCKEDLLSPLSFTQDNAQLKAMLDIPAEQDTLVGVFGGHPTVVLTAGNEKIMEYEALPPLTGPDGVCWSQYVVPVPRFDTFITKYCKTPEIAFRFLDFLKSEEASMTGRFGREGTDWWYVEDGNSLIKDLGFEGFYDIKLGALTNTNIVWGNQNGVFLPSRIMGGRVSGVDENEAVQHATNIHYGGFLTRYGKTPKIATSLDLRLTFEESDEIKEIEATINSYVEEARSRFIVGELDLDRDWDKYLKDLQSMGLERYLQIYQDCYSRTK